MRSRYASLETSRSYCYTRPRFEWNMATFAFCPWTGEGRTILVAPAKPIFFPAGKLTLPAVFPPRAPSTPIFLALNAAVFGLFFIYAYIFL